MTYLNDIIAGEMEELSPEGYSFIKSQLELRENELEIWKVRILSEESALL